MNSFLQRQCQLILKNDNYAYLLTILFVFVPFFSWFSLAIICLFTLRKGYSAGSKMLAVSIIATILLFYSNTYELIDGLLILVTGYISAVLLRATTSWNSVGNFYLITGFCLIGSIYTFYPEYIMGQYAILVDVLKNFDSNNLVLHGVNTPGKKELMMNYVFGIKIVSLLFTAVSSLMLARFIQSALFYPGGYKQEMLNFRSNKVGIVSFLALIIGFITNYTLAIALMPIVAAYLLTAGLSVMFYVWATKTTKSGLFLIIPIVIVPYIMLPLYILIGLLDGIFNFRFHLHSKQNIKN